MSPSSSSDFNFLLFTLYTIISIIIRETKTPRVQKKGEAKKNQRLKALISNKAKKSVNESVT